MDAQGGGDRRAEAIGLQYTRGTRVDGYNISTGRPISIAEIRERLSDPVSGQQVRRVLERASERVVNTGGRPAEYRLR